MSWFMTTWPARDCSISPGTMPCGFCAGKSIGHCILTQEEINELLIGNARAGRIVVRLKGGDPLVFGRGGEEASSLEQAGIPFEIVPGVTAGLGATAYAGIPITHREASSAVAFVTGHGDPECELGQSRLDWSALCGSRARSWSTWESLISRRFAAP